jgi:uncharacterized protein
MSDKKIYKCSICDFQWQNKGKKYEKCPDCGSEEIFLVEKDEIPSKAIPTTGINSRRSYGGGGRGAGPPRVCKCSKCGYEAPKTRAVPCRNDKCPECGAPLCGAD